MAEMSLGGREAAAPAVDLEAFAAGEPEWLAGARRHAWELYCDTPLPDRVAHLWRYTEPERFLLREAVRPNGCGTPAPGSGDLHLELSAGKLAAGVRRQGGRLAWLETSAAVRQAGVSIMGLRQAAREHGDLVRPHLGRLVTSEHGKFEAAAHALWQGGVFVHVPSGRTLAAPVHVLLQPEPGARYDAPRLLAVLEAGASLTLVYEEAAAGGAGTALLMHGLVELVVGPGAELRFVSVQRQAPGVPSHLPARAEVAAGGRLGWASAALGGGLTKSDVGTVLAGNDAEVELLAVCLGQGRQHFDQHTVHDHQAARTRSNLHLRTALMEQARSVYTGLIRIARQAAGSDAYQENRNLLLSPGARAETIPELEILTDEVYCTHGATAGPVDPEQLFYLLCRGVPRPEAVRLIVAGFLEPTLARLPGELQARLRADVERRLREA